MSMTERLIILAETTCTSYREVGAMVATQMRRFGVNREAAVSYLESLYKVSA